MNESFLSAEFKVQVLKEALRVRNGVLGFNSRNKEMASIAIGFANVAENWRNDRRPDFDAINSPAILKKMLLGQ